MHFLGAETSLGPKGRGRKSGAETSGPKRRDRKVGAERLYGKKKLYSRAKRADRVWPIASGQSRLAIRVLGPVASGQASPSTKKTRLALRREWRDATGETRLARRD
uniref:Uncharacterized protein n=1 Tax=Globodera rostochiensis TaxID=31243 RepID=A0A914IEG1_GLORO